jgi:pimeloyl-ACP methyl ester carboxylesterase
MKTIFILIFGIVVGVLHGNSQELQKNDSPYSGLWLGTLKVTDQMQLQLAFEITEKENGLYAAKMNVIEQKAFDIPMDMCTISDDSIYVLLKSAGIEYHGCYYPDKETIHGTYSQGGRHFELHMARVEKLPLEVNRPQTPVRPFPYKEENILFENQNAGISLAGTLTMPNEGIKFPAAILIAGSGRTDRNETGMGHFLLLSDFLTRNGYAVLRYDKRGVGESGGNYLSATSFDFADDVVSALAYLKSRPEIDKKRIGLIGHSEGALLAPMVAAKHQNDVFFVVLMGGIGVSGSELLLKQAGDIARINGVPEEEIIEMVKKNAQYYKIVLEGEPDSITVKKLKATDPEINESTIHTLILPWFRSFLAIDPGPFLQQTKCPVLAITGENDLQCAPEENLKGIESALKMGGHTNHRILTLPGLNHLFQTSKTGSPYEYDQLEEIMAPQVLDLVVEWMNALQ